MIILHNIQPILFLHFDTSFLVRSPNEVGVYSMFFSYRLLLMIFVVSNMFLILSLF